ncbi:MAG: D-amino acid aminotransferase [Legionellales bacterium]|jgi:D-alanine transaminase|nr:D-amino acid aminotransferase [Legionellales bacterium]|tara:strand:- start:3026 stop:3865 length:840 start_codon:yes stop_codon:yes gene_type:complete
MSLVYLNGEFKPIEEASVNVLDRGFIFGDGIYEVIPVFNRKIFRFDEHMRRLETSLNKIYMKSPLSSKELFSIFEQLINSMEEYDQSIYLHITRGVSDRDHDISIANEPTVFAMSRPIRKNNLYLGVKAITHDDIRWQYCDIKATTLLSSVLLRHKAKEEGSREAILVRDGFVTEGAASNIFIHLDDKIYTPPKTNHVLPGITRDLLIEILLDYKIPLKEEAISVDMLSSASEIWLTSSTWEIVPVVELNGNLVGEGNPGPLWKEVNILYQEFKRNYCN